MADYNLFDLLKDLPFDPPEKSAKKVIDAIDKLKKELNGDLRSTSQQLKHDEINGKLRYLDEISQTIFSSDGKLTDAYKELANAKTKQERETLKAAVLLLKQSGSRVITNRKIGYHKRERKLSKEHVEEVFRNEGFEISEIDPLKALPKFPTNVKYIDDELDALRKDKAPNADLTKVTNLYAYAAYLGEKKPENEAEYRSKTTQELANLLDEKAKEFSPRNDDLGKRCASLATAGKSYVFNSEENRQKYEAYLKYKSPVLSELFKNIKNSSKQDLLDPKIAEGCIKEIFKIFGDYEVSLAVYNNEAGLKDDPYLPEKDVYTVLCHHCQSLLEFTDVEEAQKVNQCPHCKNALYKPCNKCHKPVLASLDKCPECGFVFANAALFTKYFVQAEQALRKSDFESAHSNLLQAESADPGEKSRISELRARISSAEKMYEKPVNDLRKLIAGKKFQAASMELADIIGKFPGLNVSDFDAQIKAALAQARTRFENSGKLSKSKKAEECLAILRDCVDFEPAGSFLKSTPPEACNAFSANKNSHAGNVNLSWTPSSELGVSYLLIRKQGKEIPRSIADGESLIDNTKDTTYIDKTILPGQWYSYAVFALRYGVFSPPVGESVILIAEVANVHVEQTNTSIRLSWDTPKNCTGVAISRTQNGKTTVLANDVHGSFEDTNVQHGAAYSYKLCANYANQSASQGLDIVVHHTVIIDSFSISAEQIKENTYKVSWSIKQNEIDLRVLVNDQQVRELKSDYENCELELPENGFHKITVLALSGGKWLQSENSPEINTYAPCSIDKASSSFREKPMGGSQGSTYRIELRLKIGAVPNTNVAGFYYAVRTNAAGNHWATIGEIGTAPDIQRIDIAAYRRNEEIFFEKTTLDESVFYVSLFTIYKFNGKEIISNPKTCRFERPVEADVFWKVTKKSLLGSDLKLTIEIAGNRPIFHIPMFVLCACAQNRSLLSINDSDSQQLFTIQAVDFETPQKTYSKTFDVKTGLSVKEIKNMKFFLFKSGNEPISDSGNKFVPRRITGFSGTI